MRHPSEIDPKDVLTPEEIAEARTMTSDELLAEGIHMLIEIAYEQGLTDNDVDRVLRQVIDTRAGRVRGKFKLLKD